MEKIRKFEELNEKYSQFLLDKLTGEERITVAQLRKLAKEAGIGEEVNLNSSDDEFIESIKYYLRNLIKLS